MKIIFAGTPQFAIPTFKALLASSHEICAVYTQPDRPAGRGLKISASPVKLLALEHNLPIYQPQNLRDTGTQQELIALHADVLIDVACGLLLPGNILQAPRFGCINIHPSLLPRWRGAAPIQRAILTGDTKTGVTIMQMDAGLDTGKIYKQLEIPIELTDTSASLLHKLADLGAQLLIEVLQNIETGNATLTVQNDAESTYASKITKEEAKLNWKLSATELDRIVRAFNPWPIAFTVIANETVRIWEAQPIAISANPDVTKNEPGTIIQVAKSGIDVVTGNGILRLLKIQFSGGKILPIADILNSRKDFFTINETFN